MKSKRLVFFSVFLLVCSYSFNVFGATINQTYRTYLPKDYYSAVYGNFNGYYWCDVYSQPVTSTTTGIKQYIAYEGSTSTDKICAVLGSYYLIYRVSSVSSSDSSGNSDVFSSVSGHIIEMSCVPGTTDWHISGDASMSACGFEEWGLSSLSGNIPVFKSKADAHKWFANSDPSGMVNFSDAVEVKENYSSDMPVITSLLWHKSEESYMSHSGGSSSQYGDAGYFEWTTDRPTFNIDYDIEIKADVWTDCNLGGNGYGKNDKHTFKNTDWGNILENYRSSSGFASIFKMHPTMYYEQYSNRFYSTMTALTTSALYSDGTLKGLNLNGFYVPNFYIRVRPKKWVSSIECTYGDWSVLNYDNANGNFTLLAESNQGASSEVISSGSTTTDSNQWVTDTNNKYSTPLESQNILDSIKTGFGTIGSKGLIAFYSEIFSFIPSAYFDILLLGISVGMTIFVIKFLRG